jgi:hypothetical protein
MDDKDINIKVDKGGVVYIDISDKLLFIGVMMLTMALKQC